MLVLILVLSVASAGGLGTVIENAKSYDGFFSMTATASPSSTEVNAFGAAGSYGFLTICSTHSRGAMGKPRRSRLS